MQAEAEFPSFRFATRSLPEKMRREAFCDVVGREVLRVQLDPSVEQPLDVSMRFQALAGTGIAGGDLSPLRISHIPSLATDDDLILIILRQGSGKVTQQGHSIELGAGQGAFTTNGVHGSIETKGHTNHVNLRLSRALLSERLKRPPHRLSAPIPSGSPALRLLAGYIDAVERIPLMDSVLAERASAHLYDLAALTLSSSCDAREEQVESAIRAARLQAIKADIARRLTDTDLSVEALSRRHGVSERYIQKLFAECGSTFSAHIAEYRLDLARQLLTDPRNSGRQIIDIAYAVGFNDVSHFNRRFRRQFGATPRDIRSRDAVVEPR